MLSRPRWQKVAKELAQNKVRNGLVVLSMMVGVFAIGFVVNLYHILSEDMTASYLASNPASVIFYLERFDDELVATVRQMGEVDDAEGRRWIPLRFQVNESEWRNLTLFAFSDYNDVRISQVTTEGGEWPPGNRKLLVERTSVNFLNAGIGDSVRIRTSGGIERDLPVVGQAYDVNQRSAELRGQAYGYITMDSLEWLEEPYGYNQLYVIVAGDITDPGHIVEVVGQVRMRIEKSGYQVRYIEMPPMPGKHPDDDKMQAIIFILGFIGVFSLFSSLLLVVNNISFLLTQQVRQIGVMKSIGASAGQIMFLYLAMIFVLSLVALAVAIPSTIYGARSTAVYLAQLVNFDLETLTSPPQLLLIEIGVGLVVPLVATLYPVFMGVRITVREAIASYGLGGENQGTDFINKLLLKVRGLPRPLMLSLRNAFRRKARLILTLVTLILGGTMFVAITNLQASAMDTLDGQLAAYGRYDVQILLREPARLTMIDRVVAGLPDVDSWEAWAFELGRRIRADGFEGPSFSMVGIPEDSQVLRPILLEGRWLLPDDQNSVVVSAFLLASEPGLGVGDTMTVKLDGRETFWTIVGVTNGPLGERMAYANFASVAYQTRDVNRAQIVSLITQAHDPASQFHLGSLGEKAFTEMGMDVSQVKTTEQLREQVMSEFSLIIIFLVMMAVLLAIIGGVGLVGTMSINVLERTREIGVLRAIGASDGAIGQIILVEGMVIGVVSWFLAVLLAVPLGLILSNQVGQMMAQAPFDYRLSWGGLVLWLGIALLLTLLATLLPARRAMAISVREALAYE